MSSRIVRRFVVAIVMVLIAPAVNAQLFRAYLSPAGSDSNPCTLPAPCRLLPAAMNAVADDGEVWILGSANYNTATVEIAKSVRILAVPGVVGSFVATNGTSALHVATAGVKLGLRNLSFASLPGPAGSFGVQVDSGAGVAIENCRFEKLGGGLFAQGNIVVHVTDSMFRDISVRGIQLLNGPKATFVRVQVLGTNTGVYVEGGASSTTRATITDSIVADSLSFGVFANSTHPAAIVNVAVQSSTVARSGAFGAVAQSSNGAAVTLSLQGNLFAQNATAVFANFAAARVLATGNVFSDQDGEAIGSVGGTINSAGNNTGIGNGAANGAITPATMF